MWDLCLNRFYKYAVILPKAVKSLMFCDLIRNYLGLFPIFITFSLQVFEICTTLWDTVKIQICSTYSHNYLAFFLANIWYPLFFIQNFWIGLCLIFEINCVKLLKKLEKLHSLGNNWIIKKKLQKYMESLKRKKVEILGKLSCTSQHSDFILPGVAVTIHGLIFSADSYKTI